jgi:UDPglucose 6-dehydrogenase
MWIANILEVIKKKFRFKKITILGLAYKVGTHSIKNSPAIHLISKMSNYKIKVFDPVVKQLNFKKNVTICNNASDAIKDSDVLIVATPWPIFKKINYSFLKKNIKQKILIDPFNLYNKNNLLKKNIIHISMGHKYDFKKK